MKTFISKLFSSKPPSAQGLSEIVHKASVKEQSRFVKKVIRESNKDQKNLVEKYKKEFSRA